MSTRFPLTGSNNYLRFGLPSIRKAHPCCGMSLDTGAKVIAVIQMIMSAFFALCTLAILITLVVAMANHEKTDENSLEEYINARMGLKFAQMVLIITMLMFCGMFCFHLYLFKGIQQKNYRRVNLWWKVVLALEVVLFLQNVITTIRKGEGAWNLSELVILIFDLYSLWVIYEYKTELARVTDPTVEFERVL